MSDDDERASARPVRSLRSVSSADRWPPVRERDLAVEQRDLLGIVRDQLAQPHLLALERLASALVRLEERGVARERITADGRLLVEHRSEHRGSGGALAVVDGGDVRLHAADLPHRERRQHDGAEQDQPDLA